jgi:hypothetical protein
MEYLVLTCRERSSSGDGLDDRFVSGDATRLRFEAGVAVKPGPETAGPLGRCPHAMV